MIFKENKVSVRLLLVTGDPEGCFKVTQSGWTGIAYKIPKGRLSDVKDRKELNQNGLYFLFSKENGQDAVRIGQAEKGILNELDNASDTIAVTAECDPFTKRETAYLAGKLSSAADNAGKYIVYNKKSDVRDTAEIREERKAELDDYLEHIAVILYVLGYSLFTSDGYDEVYETEDEMILNTKGADAKGYYVEDGFVLESGSKIRENLSSSCPESIRKRREENGDCIGENFTTTEDILFKTAALAASFVLGRSAGDKEWK